MLRKWCLFLFVLLPGVSAIGVCAYYLFGDWGKLIDAFGGLERAIATGADQRELSIATSRDLIFRINAFADGVGVMLGAILFGVGVHGLCTLQPERAADAEAHAGPSTGRRAAGMAQGVVATVIVLATGVFFAGLIRRVGLSNELRRAVVRGDAPAVQRLVGRGADPGDRLWWGSSPVELAQEQESPRRERVLAALAEVSGHQ